MNPLFSIIVPIYNSEKYLCRCIDSILAQSYTDFELLLIDDGSKDASGKICDEYAARDTRVRVFHKENGGVSSARNLGLLNARGGYLTFVDSDDMLLDDWSVVANGILDDETMLITGFHIVAPNGSETDVVPVFEGTSAEWIESKASDMMMGALWNKCFSRKVIEQNKLRFDSRFSFREDEEFVLRYLIYCKKVCQQPLVTYLYFEPDWNKYNSAYRNLNAFWLLSGLCESLSAIGVGGSRKQKYLHEFRYRLLFNIKANPSRTIAYLKEYCRIIHQQVCKSVN